MSSLSYDTCQAFADVPLKGERALAIAIASEGEKTGALATHNHALRVW